MKNPLAASNVAITILKTNPGIDRVVSTRLRRDNIINSKAIKTSEYKRKLFYSNFENGRKKRMSLYDKLKPKLEKRSRNLIEKNKTELKGKNKPKSWTLNKKKLNKNITSKNNVTVGIQGGSNSVDRNSTASFDEDENDEQTAVLSRRSSLRSSLLDVARNESFDSVYTDIANRIENTNNESEVESNKPELIVTKVVTQEKMSALLPLLPGPTPTRFLGKIQLLKEENKVNKRKTESAPVNPDDDREATQEKSTNSRKSTPLSKIKMNIMGNLSSASRKNSIVPSERSETSKTSTPSPSNVSVKTDLAPKPSPNGSSRKGNGSTDKKKPGLSTFKAKTGFLGGKKKRSSQSVDSNKGKYKEIKCRLFFQTQIERSDDEILRNLGLENLHKICGQGIDEISNAATFMNKFLRIKNLNRSKQGAGNPGNVGSIKENFRILKNSALSTTIFLGKIISKKDKYGLFRGSENSPPDNFKESDNPLLVALQRVKSKHQALEYSDSRPGSGTSYKIPRDSKEEKQNLAFEETTDNLQSDLFKVKLLNIKEWNLHKHIKSDRELKAILIPF